MTITTSSIYIQLIQGSNVKIGNETFDVDTNIGGYEYEPEPGLKIGKEGMFVQVHLIGMQINILWDGGKSVFS